jgi:ribosomal protein S27AE
MNGKGSSIRRTVAICEMQVFVSFHLNPSLALMCGYCKYTLPLMRLKEDGGDNSSCR